MSEADGSNVDFYAQYGDWKAYATPSLKAKHVAQFDREFWIPTGCQSSHRVLEVGCGTGQFLMYLQQKGLSDFLGLDRDPRLAEVIPAAVRDRFRAVLLEDFLDSSAEGRVFDHIVLLDVIEHFPPEDGVRLLRRLAKILTPAGTLYLKLPNASSPWGLKYQFGDLTHKAAYTPGSLAQLGRAAGFADVRCYAQITGSPFRRFADHLVHRALGRILMTPPDIWSANFIAVLQRRT